MQPGDFDTRVTFQRKAKVSDGGGGQSVNWQEMTGVGLGRRWAALWPVSQAKTDEQVTVARVSNAPDYRLIVRLDTATRQVKSNWRVLIDDTFYAIKSIGRPDRQRGTITMIIQKGQPT